VTEQQLVRMAKRRLAILRHAEEITGNVALTCRYYGISRQCFYTWRRRYDQHGLDGLRDRSSRPRPVPTPPAPRSSARSSTCASTTTSARPGSRCTSKRYHDIQLSPSGVWRILKRLGLNRLSASQRYKRHDRRWKRYEKPLPGHRVQIDVKFIQPLASAKAKKYYQFTVIDDCTRLRVLRIYPKLNQQTAIQFLDYVLERLPFRVQVIQTDNGVEFGASFHWHVLDKGVGHVYIKPRTPRLNGKVERSHRIDAEEFNRLLEEVVIDDAQVFNDKLQDGKTSTTTIDPTAAWTARRPMSDSSSAPRPGRKPHPVSCTARPHDTVTHGLVTWRPRRTAILRCCSSSFHEDESPNRYTVQYLLFQQAQDIFSD
jgi:transposase